MKPLHSDSGCGRSAETRGFLHRTVKLLISAQALATWLISFSPILLPRRLTMSNKEKQNLVEESKKNDKIKRKDS